MSTDVVGTQIVSRQVVSPEITSPENTSPRTVAPVIASTATATTTLPVPLPRSATAGDDALRELQLLLPGQVALPATPGWESTRLGWIVNVDQRPAAVVTVREEQDVVDTVRWAARHGRRVSAQPVGHAPTTALDDTVVLRTRALAAIEVDPVRRVARVGAGAKWGEVLAATAPHGLTGLAGSTPDVSVAGYCLGGGLSWFGRAHGLGAESVLALEVVDATGAHRRVTAASDPDLFWALRGGGGDFAIVTALEIRLYPAPHVYGGRLLWPIEMARPVLSAFRRVTATAPDELTLWTHLLRFPPIPEIPEPLRGNAFVSVELAYLGTGADAERLIAPLREIPALWADTTGTVRVDELGEICQEAVDPSPAREFSGALRDLDEAAVEDLLRVAGPGVDVPLVVVQIRHLGGALARGGADTATGPIVEPYQLFCLGIPAVPELDAPIQAAVQAVASAMSPHLTGRTPFTFLGASPEITRAFTTATLARLRQVKARVDPHGIIRSNRPVLGV